MHIFIVDPNFYCYLFFLSYSSGFLFTSLVSIFYSILTLALQTPCYYGHPHPNNTDSSYIPASEINFRYYGLLLLRTLILGPKGVRDKGN